MNKLGPILRTVGAYGPLADALDLLEPLYGRFTEGFETADLIAARQSEMQTSTLNHRHSPYRRAVVWAITVTAIRTTASQRKRQRGPHGVDVGFTE
jgi:hypothetical protein